MGKQNARLSAYYRKARRKSYEKLSFEASIQELEEIVAKLENGEESLEESLKLFEKGTKLASSCYQTLEKAEQKITELSKLEEDSQEANR